MNTKRMTIYAMLIALTVALSLTILVPIPATNGFVTLCEAGIYTTALLFGPFGGFVVGASSGLFIDLLSGYPQWALFSLLIHGLQGLVSGYFAEKTSKGRFVGLFIGSCLMISGYFLAGWFLYDWPAGVASIPGNIFQNIIGVGLALPLTQALKRTRVQKKVSNERKNKMSITEESLKQELTKMVNEVLAEANLKSGDLFVLGCSTSEVVGGQIGKNSSAPVGQWIIQTIREILQPLGVALAVQGCEHINRALVVERSVAEQKQFEIVSVVPALHAGGACSVAAFDQFDDPVEVEHVVAQAGIDIGDTSIGMHVKHVQVPVRPSSQTLGAAHVTALRSRPKYIGGPRAEYEVI